MHLLDTVFSEDVRRIHETSVDELDTVAELRESLGRNLQSRRIAVESDQFSIRLRKSEYLFRVSAAANCAIKCALAVRRA